MATLNGVNYSNTSGLLLKTNSTTQMSISTGGVIQFNQSYTFPTSDGSANTVLLTNGSGALSFSTIPNASLDNSSMTIAGVQVSLGGSIAGDDIISNVSAGQITNSQLANSSITINGSSISLGGSITVGDITNVSAGNGLTGGGSSGSVTLNVGAGTGIDVAADSIAVDMSELTTSTNNGDGDFFIVVDSVNAQKKLTKGNINISGFNNDAGFTTNTGTVTSVAISGTDGIDVDSGSPITSSGTITLGLSNVPNSALSNSSVTVGTTAISLGGSSTTLAGLTSVTSTAFVGDLTGDVNGNASTADSWSSSRTLTLGTDLSGNVSFDGSANFTLNASIVSGAVGSTELATNAVTTTKITDGNVTNAKLANSSFTVNAPSGSDPVVPLGGTLNFTSSDSSVVIAGNSTTDTIDLTVGGSVDTFVTGGTFTSGTLSLELNDGSSAQDITGLWSSIPNSALSNSSITVGAGSGLANGGSVSLGGSVTLNVGAGTGIQVNANDVALDYAGTNNFIDSATNLEGTSIALGDTIIYHDATDNNVKKGFVSDLPFTNSSGSVTSVAISGTDGIDVDSGSPITSSGTITLGLSNVPNTSLANSSVTVTGGNGLTGGGAVSLGGSVTLNVGAGTLIDVDGSNVNVDLSELATSTSNADGDFFVVVDSANAQKKLTKANINNSGFNNDAGYITSAGNTNLYSTDGTISGTRTLNQSGRDLQFRATGTEDTKFYRSTTTTNTVTRVFMEANDDYENVLELFANGGAPNLVEGYDQGQASVFRVDSQGNLTAISKAFDIPHPNPEKQEQGMRLKHGNLEGPEHGVYVRGRQLNDKEIELPEYWRDLVDPDSITVQLTSVGSHQNLYVKKIEDNVVYIGNGNLFSNKIDCYYFIQAERKDINKITVEY